MPLSLTNLPAPQQPPAAPAAPALKSVDVLSLCTAAVSRLERRYRLTSAAGRGGLSQDERDDLAQDLALIALRRFGVRGPAGTTVPAGAMGPHPIEYLTQRARSLAARSRGWRDTLDSHRTAAERQREDAPMVAALETHAADADTAAILASLPADVAPLAAGDWTLAESAAADMGSYADPVWTPAQQRRAALALLRSLSADPAGALALLAAEQGASVKAYGQRASEGAAIIRAAFTPADAAAIVRSVAERRGYVLPASGSRPIVSSGAAAAAAAVESVAAASGARIAAEVRAAGLLDTCWRDRDADPAGASCPLDRAAEWGLLRQRAAVQQRRQDSAASLPRAHRRGVCPTIPRCTDWAAVMDGLAAPAPAPIPPAPAEHRTARTDPAALLAAARTIPGLDTAAVSAAVLAARQPIGPFKSLPAARCLPAFKAGTLPTDPAGSPTPARYPDGLHPSRPIPAADGWQHDTADTAPMVDGCRLCGCPSCRQHRADGEGV